MNTQPAINPVVNPAAFNQHAEKLHDGFNLFTCNKCGHYAGDPRLNNFRCRCPGCGLQTKFYRIIE